MEANVGVLFLSVPSQRLNILFTQNRAMGTDFLKELVAGASSVALTLYTLCPRSVGEAVVRATAISALRYGYAQWLTTLRSLGEDQQA